MRFTFYTVAIMSALASAALADQYANVNPDDLDTFFREQITGPSTVSSSSPSSDHLEVLRLAGQDDTTIIQTEGSDEDINTVVASMDKLDTPHYKATETTGTHVNVLPEGTRGLLTVNDRDTATNTEKSKNDPSLLGTTLKVPKNGLTARRVFVGRNRMNRRAIF